MKIEVNKTQAVPKKPAVMRMNEMARAILQKTALAWLSAAIGLCLSGTPVFAQADISARIAAETDRRIQAEQDAAQVRQAGPAVITDPLNRRDLPPAGGATVLLSSITFSPPSAFLSDAELDAIKSRYVGRRVDFAGLSELVRDVNDLYAEKGIVTAAAILGPQDLAGGDLVISLVEGQVGVVAVVGERQTKTDFITNRVRFARGTTVDIPTAANDISYFNQTNRAQLRLLLQPGAAFGLTDLVFGVTEPAPEQLQFFFDNNGATSTGEFRASMIYRRYGFFGIDDTFLLYVEGTEGSQSATMRFDIPITTAGTRLAFSGTLSSYDVVDGPTLPLNISGRAGSLSLTLTQPLIATDKYLLQVFASGFDGQSKAFSAGVPIVNSETSKLSAGLSFGAFDDNWTFGSQVQFVSATVDDIIAGTSTRYSITTGSLDGTYRFANGVAFIGRGSWQATNEVLLPGDLLFQIGGPTTVRGYPSDGVAGDSGYYANFEFHKAFTVQGKTISGFVFADIGEVFSTFPAVTTLVSAGIGASYNFNKHSRLEVVAGIPLKQSLANQSDFTLSATLTLSQF